MRFYPLEKDIRSLKIFLESSFSGNEVKRVSTDYTSSEPLEEHIWLVTSNEVVLRKK